MSIESRRIKIIIELLSKYYSESESGFIASTGLEALDDCAVIPISKDYELIIGSDFIRGEGFTLYRKGVISLEDIGFYLIAANASDLAAMGALPVGVTVVFRYTQNMTDDDFSKVMIGVMKACKEFKLPLLGGDTGGYEKSVLSACAIGVCPRGRSLLRSKGKTGDSIYVTGDVGGAGAALSYFARIKDYGVQLTKSEEEELLGRNEDQVGVPLGSPADRLGRPGGRDARLRELADRFHLQRPRRRRRLDSNRYHQEEAP